LIIFCFIIFWPVGLLLLFIRLGSDRTAAIKSAWIISAVSYVMLIIGSALLIAAIADVYGVIMPAIALLIGGVVLNRVARQTRVRSDRYKSYIALIVNQGVASIDVIAQAVGQPYEAAVADLQKMITAGYFAGAFIDYQQRLILLAHSAPGPYITVPSSSLSAFTAAPPQTKTVTCSSCGANNAITIGSFTECEYCGSPLE